MVWIKTRNESESFEVMKREGEALHHFIKLSFFPLVVKRNQFNPLEHVQPVHWDIFSLCEVGLEDVEESLQNHLLNMVACKLLVNSVKGTVEFRAHMLSQYAFLLIFPFCYSIVLLLVASTFEHTQLAYLTYLHFKPPQYVVHGVFLDADVDFWELPEEVVVEVAQFDPSAH